MQLWYASYASVVLSYPKAIRVKRANYLNKDLKAVGMGVENSMRS